MKNVSPTQPVHLVAPTCQHVSSENTRHASLLLGRIEHALLPMAAIKIAALSNVNLGLQTCRSPAQCCPHPLFKQFEEHVHQEVLVRTLTLVRPLLLARGSSLQAHLVNKPMPSCATESRPRYLMQLPGWSEAARSADRLLNAALCLRAEWAILHILMQTLSTSHFSMAHCSCRQLCSTMDEPGVYSEKQGRKECHLSPAA